MVEGRVTWLHVTPVKSTALHTVDEVWLDAEGARDDRRFLLVDDRDHLVNGTTIGPLVQLRADWDGTTGVLALTMPDGETVRGEVHLGVPRTVTMYRAGRTASPVLGAWSEALSAWADRPLSLVQPTPASGGVDRGPRGGATLLGTASLTTLAAELGVDGLDPRRFRMLIGIEGLPAFAEDGWVAQRVAVGDATLLVHGNVGRCVVTTQDPDSGTVDLPTLRALERLRGSMETTERLPFGVWAEVVVPGRVALGDRCAPADVLST